MRSQIHILFVDTRRYLTGGTLGDGIAGVGGWGGFEQNCRQYHVF